MRKINRACDEARKRVSAMNDDERKALEERGLAITFPNGWWACAHRKFSVRVAKGSSCRICAAQEESPSGKLSQRGKGDSNGR